jgi:hypothetical protein
MGGGLGDANGQMSKPARDGALNVESLSGQASDRTELSRGTCGRYLGRHALKAPRLQQGLFP